MVGNGCRGLIFVSRSRVTSVGPAINIEMWCAMSQIKLRVSALCLREGHVLFIEHKSFAPDDPALPPTYWILPGGVVEKGETLHDALRREMMEETGLRCRIGGMVFVKELLYPNPGCEGSGSRHHSVSIGFRCEVTGGELMTGSDPELSEEEQMIIESKWLPIERLHEYELYPPFLKDLIADDLADYSGKVVPQFYDSLL